MNNRKAERLTDREFVVSHLDVDGTYSNILTDNEWAKVYLNADGFPFVDCTYIAGSLYKWDFEHILESSPEAFARMAAEIRRLLGNR
tara:strand:- start:2315 stop:2575 length:261 start_codon:yes stop_codon:yes gene_type:complete